MAKHVEISPGRQEFLTGLHCRLLHATTHRSLIFIIACLLTLVPHTSTRAANDCPAEGDGGDALLNRLKNRTTQPPSFREMTVEQFVAALTPNLHTPRYRNRFSYAHRHYVDQREGQGVALVGHILDAKQSGPESANCHSQTRRDFHVWIGATQPDSPAAAKALRAQAVVVEPTPTGQEALKSWRLHILQRLAAQGAKVRISGWLFYDPEHPEQLTKTRGTLWEVHPVTKIEVWSGEQWREIE